ncbi:hypothetical protein Hanom_Chr17g01578191 [Helianthus anomalus]
MLGPRLRKAHSQQSKDSSPVEFRPLKRPRPVLDEYEPGFGFTGFTSSAVHEEGGVAFRRQETMGV